MSSTELKERKRKYKEEQKRDPRFKGENKKEEKAEFKRQKKHGPSSGGSSRDLDDVEEEERTLYHEAEEVVLEQDPKTRKWYFSYPWWDPGYTIGVFGSRGTGKSFIARWLAAIMCWAYPTIYIFTETTMNGYWASMANPQFIYHGYQENMLLSILKLQEKKVKAWRDGKFKGNPYALIIWDDCVPDDMMYDPLFRQIFFNGRHYCIGNWFISQYFFAVPKRYRGNLDWVFSLHQEQRAQVEAFFEEMSYAGKGFHGFNRFKQVFDNATMDRNFILFDIRDKEKPSKDRIYTGVAEDPGIFWMGSDLYWSKNIPHLRKIMSGEAREVAEKTLNYEDFGLPDLKRLKEEAGKKRKKGKEPEEEGIKRRKV
jgi:hypothetical protein